MNSIIRNINLIIATSGIILCAVSLFQMNNGRHILKETKKFFTAFFSVVIIYITCILIRELTYSFTGANWALLSRIVLFGQAFVSSLLTILVTAFLLYQSGEDYKKNNYFRISIILWIIYVLLLLYAQFNNQFYYVDSNNAYSRGPLFGLLMIAPTIIMALNVVVLYLKRNELSTKQRKAFLAYSIIPAICVVIQSSFFGIHLIALGTLIATMVMYMDITSDQKERMEIKEEENAQLKNELLLAQIRPHFLFNALTAIKHLIKEDPDTADDAITNYMTYLRHNMDSIMVDEPVPFKDELEHVNGYLELQKIRFGDELNVEYDLKYTDFKIPTLTLLPLVENAITYGIRRNEDRTGKVTISSEKYDDRIEVTVEDDGPGFIPDALPNDSERSHIGIKNVRTRIENVSKGKLIIDSTPGKGTKATIVLPGG